MGPSACWLLAGSGFVSAVVVSYRKGRRRNAVLSVFLMIGGLIWAGLLTVGVVDGYNDDNDRDVSDRGPWQVGALVVIGATPALVAYAIPLSSAIRPRLAAAGNETRSN